MGGGSYLKEDDTQVVKLDNGKTILIDKQGNVIKDFGGSASTGNGIPGLNFSGTTQNSSYTVVKGDDINKIAQANGTDINTLLSLNQNINPMTRIIQPGQKIVLPPNQQQSQVAATSKALQVILGSSKFTKDQKASVISAIQQGEDPFQVIKNQARNMAGATTATKITSFEVAQNQLKDIQSLLNTYYASGGKTSFLSGNYEKVVNKLGTQNDPNLVAISTQIAAALQIYRNAVSGTAYSVQEGRDIASIFPGINKNSGLNTSILDGRMQAFQSTIDGEYRSQLGSLYDELNSIYGNGGGGTSGTTSSGVSYTITQ